VPFRHQYTNKESALHLVLTLSALYTIKVKKGDKYLGFTIEHDLTTRTITLTVPGYIDEVLKRFHRDDHCHANCPCAYIPPQYGQQVQTITFDHTTTLHSDEITEVDGIV